MGGFQSNFAQPAFSPAMQSKGKEPMTEQFDEAAFERAFDMAKEDMMVDATPASAVENAQAERADESLSFDQSQTAADMSRESHQLHQNEVLHGLNDQHQPLDMQDRFLPEEVLREGQQESQQSTRESDDALAATAQELLEKVENNQTDKFKNSQFLSLMRKLRDREVKVEGDKMVETTNTASTSTADLPLNSVSAPRFNNSEQIPRHEQDLDANRHRRLSLGLDSGAWAEPVNPADGSDVVNLLSQPGLPGGEPSTPLSLESESDASNLNFGDDMERRRLSAMWHSMLPNSGPDRRTHSARAEESGLGGPAFTA